MSSATPRDPYASSQLIKSPAGSAVARGGTDAQDLASKLPMTARQQELTRCWNYYRGRNYDAYRFDYNGHRVLEHTEHDFVATEAYLPPGFYDAGKALPIKFRRPSAPYNLVKIVVDRFTGLLFGQKRRPTFTVPGDQDTQDYAEALAKAGRLWPAMIKTRTRAGAMKSCAVGFSLTNGRPQYEVHDARWCFPDFIDVHSRELERLEIRYLYEDEFIDREHNELIRGVFWYRRVIDDTSDTVWRRVPAEQDEEPEWDQWKSQSVEHNLGFCPVVWFTNIDIEDETDGDEDCHDIYELQEEYDRLMTQGSRAIIATCAPVPVINTDADLGSVSLDTENALKLEVGGSASFLEPSGAGPAAAREQAKVVRQRALEIAACADDDAAPDAAAQTATEIVTRVSRMLERADILREHWGFGLQRLMEISLSVCRKATQVRPGVAGDGKVVPISRKQGTVQLPPRFDDKTKSLRPYVLGESTTVTVEWPNTYFEPTLDDCGKAATAASTALTAGAIDKETAAKFLKAYFPIEDIPAMLKNAAAAAASDDADMHDQVMATLRPPGGNAAPPRKSFGG